MKTFITSLMLSVVAISGCKTESSEATATTTSKEIASPPPSTAVMDRGRELTALFYKGETGQIWSRMTPEMQNMLGSEEKLAAFRQQVDGQLGAETKVIDEKTTASAPYQIYLRTASFSKFGKPVAIQWTLDANGQVAGFFVKPAG